MSSSQTHVRKALQLSKNETAALDYILPPSGQTLRELTHQQVHYLILQAQTCDILQTDPPRMKELGDALIASPDRAYIAVITGKPGDATPRPLGSPSDQNGRWEILEKYRVFLEKEPGSYEDHFWRAVYGTSAAMMLQEFITEGMYEVKGGPKAANKYMGQRWEEEFRKAYPNPPKYTPKVLRYEPSHEEAQPAPQRSPYILLTEILSAGTPPGSEGGATLNDARQLISNEDHLKLMEFCAFPKDTTVHWKVKSIDQNIRNTGRCFWVQFCPAADLDVTPEEISLVLEVDDYEREIRIAEDELIELISRSTRL